MFWILNTVLFFFSVVKKSQHSFLHQPGRYLFALDTSTFVFTWCVPPIRTDGGVGARSFILDQSQLAKNRNLSRLISNLSRLKKEKRIWSDVSDQEESNDAGEKPRLSNTWNKNHKTRRCVVAWLSYYEPDHRRREVRDRWFRRKKSSVPHLTWRADVGLGCCWVWLIFSIGQLS
jgi:hypothetical protein